MILNLAGGHRFQSDISPKVQTSTQLKRVTFSKGTAPPKETFLAVSISSHETERKHVEYCIDVWQAGFQWTARRRYRDFENLQKTLIAEVGTEALQCIDLPQKRWFESKRWLNRLDPKYNVARRKGLELYLRALLKIPGILGASSSLRSFLVVSILTSPDKYAEEIRIYESYRSLNTIIYDYEDEILSPANETTTSSERSIVDTSMTGLAIGQSATVTEDMRSSGTLPSFNAAATTGENSNVDNCEEDDEDEDIRLSGSITRGFKRVNSIDGYVDCMIASDRSSKSSPARDSAASILSTFAEFESSEGRPGDGDEERGDDDGTHNGGGRSLLCGNDDNDDIGDDNEDEDCEDGQGYKPLATRHEDTLGIDTLVQSAAGDGDLRSTAVEFQATMPSPTAAISVSTRNTPPLPPPHSSDVEGRRRPNEISTSTGV